MSYMSYAGFAVLLLTGCTQPESRQLTRLSENAESLQKAVTDHFEGIVISQGTPECRYSSDTVSEFWAYQQGAMRIIQARALSLNDTIASGAVERLAISFDQTRTMEKRLDDSFRAGQVTDPCLDSVTAMELEAYQAGTLDLLKQRANMVK